MPLTDNPISDIANGESALSVRHKLNSLIAREQASAPTAPVDGNYRITGTGVLQVLDPDTGEYHSLSVKIIEGEAHLIIDPTGEA